MKKKILQKSALKRTDQNNSNPQLRNSGLNIVGKLPWGTHFCQFYQTQKDLSDVLVPYFKAGLENNEFCIWVTSEFLTKEEAIAAMKKGVPDFSTYWKKGQIEIFPYTNWYLEENKFEMDRVLKKWVDKHDEGLSRGFAGMRVSGNPFWIDNKKDWDDFAAYEAKINKVIGPYKLLVLCTYSLEKCHANEIIDVVTNHEFALIKRSGKWELIENSGKKRMEEALKNEEEFSENILQTMPDGLDIVDKNLNILYMNKTLKKMFGNHIGKKCYEVYKTDKKQCENCPLKNELNGKTKTMEITGIKGDKTFFVSHKSIALNGQKNILEIFSDITEKKKLEQQKDVFLGVATHELKTPITSIKAYAQILNKVFYDKKDIRSTQMLTKMENQINKIIDLITDLLDITKINTGKLEFRQSYFDFNEIVNDVIEEVQLTSLQHKIIKKMDRTKSAYGDKERIGQVITNFLTNAIKYSPKSDRIIVKTKAVKKEIKLFVKDLGVGIPKEQQKKIFERFYRVEDSLERTPKGLGLGLYISSEIIKRHNGKLGVRSEFGKGSTFYFTLPLKNEKTK